MFSRVYNQPNEEDLEILRTCQLLEEWEQDLKSLKNYKESIDHILSKYPNIQMYLQKNLLPFPAEWPGWYYPKKLIVDNCSGKYGSIIPEQGQFHVSLYAVEDTVVIFKHLINCSPLCLGGFSKVKRKPLYGLSKSESTPRRLRCYKPACTTEYIQMIDHRINIHVELLVLVS